MTASGRPALSPAPPRSQRYVAGAATVLVALGLAIRLRQYLSLRSIWNDEALLALNIIDRGFADLLRPLDFNQGAPVGFLWGVKLSILVFGPGEFALRLVPLLAGCVSVVLFWFLARSVLSGIPALLCLFLFAVSSGPVYYATETKQYSVDLCLTVLVAYVTVVMLRQPPRRLVVAAWAATCATVIWFSHPVVFVVAAVSAVALLLAAADRDRARLRLIGSGVGLWVASLVVDYLVVLRALGANAALNGYWADGFAPSSGGLGGLWSWLGVRFTSLLSDPLGMGFVDLAVVPVLAGLVALPFLRREGAVLSVIPLAAFAAATLHLYPLKWRLALYLVPVLLLALGATVDLGWRLRVRGLPVGVVVPAALVVVLAFPAAWGAAQAIRRPYTMVETREAIRFVVAHRQSRDLVYVHWTDVPAFLYYQHLYDLPLAGTLSFDPPLSGGCSEASALAPVAGRRVWVVMGFPPLYDPLDDAALTKSAFSAVAPALADHPAPGNAEAVLYAVPRHLPDRPLPAVLAPGSCLRFGGAPPGARS